MKKITFLCGLHGMEKGDFSFLESIFIVRAGIVFELKIVYYYLKEGAIVRRKSLFSIPGLCLISIAWYLYADQQITVIEVGTQACVIPFSNVDDLINHPQVNLIVKATVTSNSQPKTYVLEEKLGMNSNKPIIYTGYIKVSTISTGLDSRESEIEMIKENYRHLKASIKERLL